MMDDDGRKMLTEDRLWANLGETARQFSAEASHNSDAFSLLACILAYYQARGSPPETMIGPAMQERIAFLLKQAEEE